MVWRERGTAAARFAGLSDRAPTPTDIERPDRRDPTRTQTARDPLRYWIEQDIERLAIRLYYFPDL